MLDQLQLLIGEALIWLGLFVMPRDNSDTDVWRQHIKLAESFIYEIRDDAR